MVALLAAALLVVAPALAGCSSSPDDTAPISALEDLPETASSGARIDAALDAGEIDKPTSLLYHLWAQFGDPSLPKQFRGAPEQHDLGVLNEAYAALETMPADIRSQVEPFLQRPSHPTSAFNARDAGAESGTTEDSQALAVRNVALVEESDGPTRCQQDWVSEAVPGQPFRVWACPDGGTGTADAAIAAVSAVLAEKAPSMITDAPSGMGAPIPDDPQADANQPADDRIDIYVLPQGWLAPFRDLNERRMDDSAAAITMAAAPRSDTSSSAYMLLSSYLLEHPDALERVLVHEVFHVLEYAHFRGLDQSTAWVFEAGAVWAESYFTAGLSENAYRHHMKSMQQGLSLLDSDMGHRYSAFLWFLFLQQQAGPEAVFGVWNALDSAPPGANSDAVVAAIESQVDLDAALPEFAMRLLNADMPGDPLPTRFHDIAANFPDNEMPDLPAQQLSGDSLRLDHEGIAGLGYRYSRVTLATPASEGTAVRVTSDLATDSGTSPSIQALVQGPGGDYTRVPIEPAGTDLCVASELLLAVTNLSDTITDLTSGAITVARGEETSCGEPVTAGESASPSPTPSSSPPAAPSSPPEAGTPIVSGDFCTDMLAFQAAVMGLADGSGLPVTADRVDAIFALAKPYLAGLPDGGIGQVEVLRSYAEQAADQPAASATTILGNEEFQRNATAIAFLVRTCGDAN